MFDRLREDISTFKRRDPAARSALEIFFLYPGLKAIRMHRRANWCYRRRMFFLARWISQRAARKTGIEIHPAATIGRRFFIDHGTGVVIGETAVIGDDVMIYQGVTLGGTGKDTGKRLRRYSKRLLVALCNQHIRKKYFVHGERNDKERRIRSFIAVEQNEDKIAACIVFFLRSSACERRFAFMRYFVNVVVRTYLQRNVLCLHVCERHADGRQNPARVLYFFAKHEC